MAIPLIKQLREDMGVGTVGIPAACDCVRVSPNTLATMDNAIMNLDLLGGDTGTLQPLFDDLRSGKYQVTNNDCCMDIADTTVAALEAELAANTVDYPVPFFPSYWEPLPTAATGGDTILIGRYDTELYDRNDCTFKITTNSGDYSVDWGDGTTETISSGTVATHTYASGVYVVTVTGDLQMYYADFRHGAENLYATGLNEQHYYGVGWAETWHKHSNVKYYFEHDDIHQVSVYAQFYDITDIFVSAVFNNSTQITSQFQKCVKVWVDKSKYELQTSSQYTFYMCGIVYAPLLTYESSTSINNAFYLNSEVYLPNFDGKLIEDGVNAFNGVDNLILGSFRFPSLTDGNYMFNGCSGMTQSQCVEVLNSLPDVTAIDPDPKIDFRNTAGASQLTATEITIGTDKGWEVLT